MPSDDSYDSKTGIYTTAQNPSDVFQGGTKFNVEQAIFWHYNHRGYNWGNLNLQFPSGMSEKSYNILFLLRG